MADIVAEIGISGEVLVRHSVIRYCDDVYRCDVIAVVEYLCDRRCRDPGGGGAAVMTCTGVTSLLLQCTCVTGVAEIGVAGEVLVIHNVRSCCDDVYMCDAIVGVLLIYVTCDDMYMYDVIVVYSVLV